MEFLKKIKNFFLSMRQKQKIPIIKESSKDSLLKNRTAMITGGTGAIGQAIATAFINDFSQFRSRSVRNKKTARFYAWME